MSVKSDNFYNKKDTSIEVEIANIKGELKLLSQGQETTNKSLEEIKVQFRELNNSIPQIRNTVNLAYDKVVELGKEIIVIRQEEELNSDFRKQAKVTLQDLHKEVAKNTNFRNQAETVIKLIKLIGIPTLISILYLYGRVLTNGQI